mmetsp:Transcript_47413/g.94606  ORF Transcript_47413/g.94606 Transcript_47413/m.94606 type:complete len:202 (+) Transcript_47413:504-1109(+)
MISVPLRYAFSHPYVGRSRVSHRLATPPPNTRETTSSVIEKRSSRIRSAWLRSTSHTSSRWLHPCHVMRFSMPNFSISCAARAVRHASIMRCFSRGILVYLSRIYSRPPSFSEKSSPSVMKARVVCMPLTSDSLRSERYWASAFVEGAVATLEWNGSLVPARLGSSTTMDPHQGSVCTLTPSDVMVRPVQTRSTMQSTTWT